MGHTGPHRARSPPYYRITETAFTPARLSEDDLARTRALCAFIQANGSGFGICRSCRYGALGASEK